MGGSPDPEIDFIVKKWQALMNQELSGVIGYVNQEIGMASNAMFNLVADSWLYSYPNADVSLTNKGGIRQSIPAGNITMGTIVGVLPFENNIVELNLTGTQLIDCIDGLVMGGKSFFYPSEGLKPS